MSRGAAALLGVMVAATAAARGSALDVARVPPKARETSLRQDALSRARLWREPPPPARMNLGRNPGGPDGFGSSDRMTCRFHLAPIGGSTTKFRCVFSDGESLKVKYGRNPEIHTEVAASRLLDALGAVTDQLYLVDKLRCFGCPSDPFTLIHCLSSPYGELRRRCAAGYGGRVTPAGDMALAVDYASFVDFKTVSIERRLEGDSIDDEHGEGWSWDELDSAASDSGPTRAERDALRLLAVLLNNWDNRRDNQRLLCPPGATRADGGCARPFAYMQDVGGTFGWVIGPKNERKLDVEGWRQVPVWKDPAACVVRIQSPRLHGATFGAATISEAGRRFLVERLRRIPKSGIRDLFEGARFAEFEGASPASRRVENWVEAFQSKVRQIADRPPCPAS